MDEIIEGTVGSLHILARDHQNRHIIRSHHCIALIIQVIFIHKYYHCCPFQFVGFSSLVGPIYVFFFCFYSCS